MITFQPTDLTDYLGTGFAYADILRYGIQESHPHIMRYEALKRWALENHPRKRPAELRRRINTAAVAARDARATLTVPIQHVYDTRQLRRDFDPDYKPEPLPPIVLKRPARTKVRGTRRTARSPDSWRMQVQRDIAVLLELGKAVPASLTPTQTKYVDGKEMPVDLHMRRHSALSCSGFSAPGQRCLSCLPIGHTYEYTQLTAWRRSLAVRD